MTRAPWLLAIVLFALLVGTVTTWTWSRSGATSLEALKAGGSAGAFTFGAGVTTFYFLS
jgi:hypothetical protein